MDNSFTDILEKFMGLSDKGITEVEVSAACKLLLRENGKKPTVFQVAEYLEELLEWRDSKNDRVQSIANKVNSVFEKGGE